jgi:hypothetical protein
MRGCLRSQKGRVMDLRFWHLHRGMDLSFVVVSGLVFVTTERTVEVGVVVVVFFEKGEDVVKVKVLFLVGGIRVVLIDVTVGVIQVTVTNNVERVYVKSWLLTDASLWIRQIFIRISV